MTVMGTLALIALLLSLFAGVGYYFLAPAPESRFFKSFSLEDLMGKARPELDLIPRGMDFEAEALSLGPYWNRSRSPMPVLLRIKESDEIFFDEGEVMKALQNEIEKMVWASGASVTGKDFSRANRVTIEYRSGRVRGWVSVSGKREGGGYEVSAELEEGAKRRRA
jgi:hypothetical protein